jgi:hypothetical protein
MNKNTSIVLVAAVAGILVASALAVTMTNAAFADNQRKKSSDNDAKAGNGGIGGAGGAGGVAGNGGINEVKHAGGHNDQKANGGSANGGDGGDANGGNACNTRCDAGN